MKQMSYEFRLGRGVDAEFAAHAGEIAEGIHNQVRLESVRVYREAPRTYRLTVLPEGRRTLASMVIRLSSNADTRGAVFAEWIMSPDVSDALDVADRHRAKPLFVERVLPVMLHEYGDGRYFHTMMINTTRRRNIVYPSRNTTSWRPAQLTLGVILEGDETGVPVIKCHKHDFSIDRTLLKLKGTDLTVAIDKASGRPLDQVFDDERIRGCGLVVGGCIRQTGSLDKANFQVELQSDLMPVAAAAALVDELRTRRDIRGVGCMRTSARSYAEGYRPAPGVTDEDPQTIYYEDRDQQQDLGETLPSPGTETPELDPIAAALLAEHGLDQAYRNRIELARRTLLEEAQPAFCLMFTQHGAKGQPVVIYNLTPWLREATVDEIRKAIGSIFGPMDEDDSILLQMAERCRHHTDGEHVADLNGLTLFIRPNRHDESRLGQVLGQVRTDMPDALERLILPARTARERESTARWDEMRNLSHAA